MLDFEQARQKILNEARVLEPELVSVAEADGRVLAEELRATVDLPGFDYSAMDGYAVRSSDFVGAPPWRLPVAAEHRAGDPIGVLAPGTASRIFTGAPLPSGADAVVMQEVVQRSGEEARFSEAPRAGEHIRRRGEDLASGAVAIERGTRLTPYWLGLSAALDRGTLSVSRALRVALLCTGDELRDPGSDPRPGSIPDSNGPSLAALARRTGAVVTRLPRTGDDLERTVAAVERALADHDVLLTVGGVSVGDHDVVKAALERCGVALDFWKVAIKPGKPLAFGRRGAQLVLGLPGNPVSAQLTLGLFGLPLLRALQGDRRALPRPISVELAEPLPHRPGRLGFYRARLDGSLATPARQQASGAPNSMAEADALILAPADGHGYGAGERALALRIEDL